MNTNQSRRQFLGALPLAPAALITPAVTPLPSNEVDSRIATLQKRIAIIDMPDSEIAKLRLRVLVELGDYPIPKEGNGEKTWVWLNQSPEMTQQNERELELRWTSPVGDMDFGKGRVGYIMELSVIDARGHELGRKEVGYMPSWQKSNEMRFSYSFGIEL